MSGSPKGILRNRDEHGADRSYGDELDRQEVIRNTELNAQLHNERSKGDEIRRKIQASKNSNDKPEDTGIAVDEADDRHAKWDEINLYKAEQERSATMKIDEPKTPYEGGFDPTGEYYQDDIPDIPDLKLGKSELAEEPVQSLNGGEVLKNEDEEEEEEEEEEPEKPLSAEERHKRFEEMRKQHYHMKGEVMHQKIDISDEE